jgi:hypothetical protein
VNREMRTATKKEQSSEERETIYLKV